MMGVKILSKTKDSKNNQLLSDDNLEDNYVVGIGASAGGLDALNRFF